MRKLGFILVLGLVTSCWAPRCPVDGCQFIREHRHSDLVSGTFRSQYRVVPTIHFPWETWGDKGEENPNDTEFVPQGKRKVKVKKKFPWERW